MADAPTTEAAPETEAAETTPDTTEENPEARGSKDQVLADLAKERDRRQSLEKELEEFRTAQLSEQEKTVKAARDEGRTEAEQQYRTVLVAARVEAAAGGKLADPSDAVRLLDLSKFELSDDLNVDRKAVEAAIDELLQSKPYLAADAPRPVGRGEGGARTPAPAGSDMNSLIRSRMR